MQTGCSVYPHRPKACRSWSCLWLTNPAWAEELRPDRCGVVFDPVIDIVKIRDKEYPAQQAWVMSGHEDAWSTPPVSTVIRAILDHGLVVLWRLPPDDQFNLTARCIAQNLAGTISISDPSPAVGFLGSEASRFARAQKLMRRRRHA